MDQSEVEQQTSEEIQQELEDRRASAIPIDSVRASLSQGTLRRQSEPWEG